jgi:ionotropic glutamate receptor
MLSSFFKIVTHFSFCSTQQCDLLVHYILPTIHRNTIVDLTLPWTYDHFALLIPAPDETANINAVIKPFQWPVCAVGSIFFDTK